MVGGWKQKISSNVSFFSFKSEFYKSLKISSSLIKLDRQLDVFLFLDNSDFVFVGVGDGLVVDSSSNMSLSQDSVHSLQYTMLLYELLKHNNFISPSTMVGPLILVGRTGTNGFSNPTFLLISFRLCSSSNSWVQIIFDAGSVLKIIIMLIMSDV